MKSLSEIQLGKAGEYLVCADLITMGFIAFPSEQGLPYDVVMDNGKQLIKIQVKTTLRPRIIPQRHKESHAYMFNVKRHGKNNQKRYTDNDVDIFALVALDSKTIGYLKNVDLKQTMILRVDALKGDYYDEKGASDYRIIKQYKAEKKNIKEIISLTGLNITTIYRMLQENYHPFKTKALYLSDLKKNQEWFIGI